MENYGSPVIRVDGGISRKKRSSNSRRPNPNPKPLPNYISSSSSSLLDTYGGYRNINEIYTNDHSRTEFGKEDFPSASYECGVKDFVGKSDRLGNKSELRRVKLKVGGITHTIQTKSMADIAHSTMASNEVCKSKCIPKKRPLDEEFTDGEDDDETRYLGKLRASKAASGYRDNHELTESPEFDYTGEYSSSAMDKTGRKKSSFHDDRYYAEEDDLASDNELEHNMSKKEHLDSLVGGRNGLYITTRKRALQNGPTVTFSIGLPAAPSTKMLPEVDQQSRKAEAAQRRRLLAEKAAKAAEAEAIRKILGQESARKKREEKIKRHQEELAQDRIGKATILDTNTVRWVMGPCGTIVTFSNDLGLPNIFGSLSDSYPPPREKCVGPNCNNEYKYRDSKSKLPLCSLHCYKAVQG